MKKTKNIVALPVQGDEAATSHDGADEAVFLVDKTSASIFGAGPPQGLGRVSRRLDECL